jgi:hypothetical protein
MTGNSHPKTSEYVSVSLIIRFETVVTELRVYLPLCIVVNLGPSQGRSLIEGVCEECWRE